MPTFHKFKLLVAAQCVTPTTSPTSSPVFHLRRKKTLRMLLAGKRVPDDARNSRRGTSPEKSGGEGDQLSARHKLKDLFVSSPPPFGERASDRLLTTRTVSDGGVRVNAFRSLSATFRQRLMRRAWRPVLVSIPETND